MFCAEGFGDVAKAFCGAGCEVAVAPINPAGRGAQARSALHYRTPHNYRHFSLLIHRLS
jgi:hypothetical protein